MPASRNEPSPDADVVRYVLSPLLATMPTPPHGWRTIAGSVEVFGNTHVDVVPSLLLVLTTCWRTTPLIFAVELRRSLMIPRSTSPRSTTTSRSEVCQPSPEMSSV